MFQSRSITIEPMLKYLTIPVTPFQQNCSLVWDDQTLQAAVIDPGGDLDVLLGAVGKLGLKLEQIWITHAHVDHAAGTAELAERFGRRVRGIVADERYSGSAGRPGVFGESASLSGESRAAGRWDTRSRSEYFAAGVGGAITGRRADVAVIDEAQMIFDASRGWAWTSRAAVACAPRCVCGRGAATP